MNEIVKVYNEKGKQWTGKVDTNETHADGITFVYVFGHSLDKTDKDVLKDFLANEATAVSVYCKDKEAEGELIANVIQLISENRLLEKVNQTPPKIEFVVPDDSNQSQLWKGLEV